MAKTTSQIDAMFSLLRDNRTATCIIFFFLEEGSLKGHRQPQVFAGVQAIGAIFCNTENGADSLHADMATAPTSYRRAVAVDRSFFTIGIGAIRRDI